MTPAERQEWERLVDEYGDCIALVCGDPPCEGVTQADIAAAKAALDAFVERLTAGEEVLQVVNPKYPGHKHYWAANNVPTFPVSYVITPGTFRVTPLDGGTDGNV